MSAVAATMAAERLPIRNPLARIALTIASLAWLGRNDHTPSEHIEPHHLHRQIIAQQRGNGVDEVIENLWGLQTQSRAFLEPMNWMALKACDNSILGALLVCC
jgi:hypothetical protein